MKRRKLFSPPLAVSAAVVLLAAAASFASASPGEQCAFEAASETLRCSLRTLNSNNGTTSSSLPSSSRSHQIRIECSDLFFFESFLRTNHFGYLPDLRRLGLDFCKIRRVPSLAFSGLSGLRHLQLRTHNSEWSAMVMELERDALTGLNQLRTLNLTHNNIWTLPPASFCGLDSLRRLNLSTNYIQDALDLGFAAGDLRSCRLPLKVLDLSDNSLSVVRTGAFGQLAKLQELYLQGNNINFLEDEAFGGLKALRTLNLANNVLVALPPDVFRDTTRLQQLYLQNNSLSTLAPGIFSSLEHLLVLNLSRNDLTNDWLNSHTFAALENLMALDLSHNRLSKLDQNIFRRLTSLKILNLRHNQIHTVADNTFVHQRNLHILYLSHNQLETLHADAIYALPLLNSLSLDHNRLRTIHRDALRNCSTLQDLAMHNNQLEDVPRALRSLPLLRTLDLGENAISHVRNDSLQGLSHLYGLRLASNGIRSLHASLFKAVPTLQVLNLAHNQLELDTPDQGLFESLKDLQMLRLDSNRLKDINGLLTAQSELQWLNVSSNRLQWFDYGSIPKSVRWLDLHDNQVEYLGNYYSLRDGFRLQTLDASANRIKKLGPLALPDSLEYVFLNRNNITEIEANTFADKNKLRRVELRDNAIQHLQLASLTVGAGSGTHGGDDGNVADAALPPEFFLGGKNPFYCDCEMEWLQKINQLANHHSQQQQQRHPRVMDLDDVQCRLSPNQSALVMPILDVRPDQFLCQYQAHCFALCLCCDFFACDCRMQCPSGCSCFHDSTWSSNVIQCSMRGHDDVPPLIPMDATAIYLDGNRFVGMLESQAFIGRKRVESLFLNNSQIEAISNQTFNGLTELQVLHLEDNHIRRLEGYEFGNLTSLRELFLQNNRINYIHELTFASLTSLEVLQLHGNRLNFHPVWELHNLPALSRVSLSHNEWSCHCDFVHKFQEFARLQLIEDLDAVQCISAEDHSRLPLMSNMTCSDAMAVTFPREEKGAGDSSGGGGGSHGHDIFSRNLIPILVLISAVSVVIACMSVMLFVFRTPLRVWLHSKYGVRVLTCSKASAKDKFYDAFVSYALKDEEFVQQVLLPQLEQEEQPMYYKLCLQHRDLPNTTSIADSFPGVSELCAKHVFVVSLSYLESEWPQIKFALQDAKKCRPVIVLLEELSPLDLAAAPEFNLLLKTAVVLHWNETGFWNKLRFYLPDASTTPPDTLFRRTQVGGGAGGGGGGTRPQSPRSDGDGMLSKYGQEWTYDAVITSNDSASTRSTIMGGSPRAFANTTAVGHAHVNPNDVQIVSNPLDGMNGQRHPHHAGVPGSAGSAAAAAVVVGHDQWSDRSDSAYSWQDHTYQTISNNNNGGGGGYDGQVASAGHVYQQNALDTSQTLGSVDVMLPNGQLVAATLVRNAAGKVVPIVPVDVLQGGGVTPSSSATPMASAPTSPVRRLQQPSPALHAEEQQPLQQQQQQQANFPGSFRQQQQQQQQQQNVPQFALLQHQNRKGHLV